MTEKSGLIRVCESQVFSFNNYYYFFLYFKFFQIGSPVYCMSWNARRHQIVAAIDCTVQVFNMRDPSMKICCCLFFQENIFTLNYMPFLV